MLLVIQSFFEGQSATWDVAKKDQNRTKNRYGNIIACKQASFIDVSLRENTAELTECCMRSRERVFKVDNQEKTKKKEIGLKILFFRDVY